MEINIERTHDSKYKDAVRWQAEDKLQLQRKISNEYNAKEPPEPLRTTPMLICAQQFQKLRTARERDGKQLFSCLRTARNSELIINYVFAHCAPKAK